MRLLYLLTVVLSSSLLITESTALWGDRNSINYTFQRDRVKAFLRSVTDDIYNQTQVEDLCEELPLKLVSYKNLGSQVNLNFNIDRNIADRADQVVADAILSALSNSPLAYEVTKMTGNETIQQVIVQIDREDVELVFRFVSAGLYSPMSTISIILSNSRLIAILAKNPGLSIPLFTLAVLLRMVGAESYNIDLKPEDIGFSLETPRFENRARCLWSVETTKDTRESLRFTLERDTVRGFITGIFTERIFSKDRLQVTIQGLPIQLISYEEKEGRLSFELKIDSNNLDRANQDLADMFLSLVAKSPFVTDLHKVPGSETMEDITVNIAQEDLFTAFKFITRSLYDHQAAMPAIFANGKFHMAVTVHPGFRNWLNSTANALWNMGE